MPFDPDAFLADNSDGSQDSSGASPHAFDPDAFLEDRAQPQDASAIAPYTGSKTFGEKLANFAKNVWASPPPSVAGMADSIKNARQNSMDVAKGTATTDQILQLHGAAALGLPMAEAPLVRFGRAPSLSTSGLLDAADTGYAALDRATVGKPFPNSDKFMTDFRQLLHNADIRLANAKPVYDALKDFPAENPDVADLVNLRRSLKDTAASKFIPQIDIEILRHGGSDAYKQLLENEKNLAIGEESKRLEQRITDAQMGNTQSGGRIEGNRIRAAVMPMLRKGGEERLQGLGESDVAAAARRVTNPGPLARTFQIGSAFDPTHSNLALLGHGGAFLFGGPHALAAAPLGFGSRLAYDAIMRNRAAAIGAALRAHAPASQALPWVTPKPLLNLPPGPALFPYLNNQGQ